jgi:hypothetical protein
MAAAMMKMILVVTVAAAVRAMRVVYLAATVGVGVMAEQQQSSSRAVVALLAGQQGQGGHCVIQCPSQSRWVIWKCTCSRGTLAALACDATLTCSLGAE